MAMKKCQEVIHVVSEPRMQPVVNGVPFCEVFFSRKSFTGSLGPQQEEHYAIQVGFLSRKEEERGHRGVRTVL